MTERTVFLVYGYDLYEYPCAPIKAFASEEGAKALLDEIAAHKEAKPTYPSDDATDEENDAWTVQHDKWVETHPAGDAWSHYGYDVMPLELEDTP